MEASFFWVIMYRLEYHFHKLVTRLALRLSSTQYLDGVVSDFR